MKVGGFLRSFSLATVVSVFGSLSVDARYADDFAGHYEDLNCAEDDCDCLEPDSNRYRVVSPDNRQNTSNEVVFVGTYEQIQKYFEEAGQTDGLPIVPPTTLKAEKFMRYTPYGDNSVVATIGGRDVTAYQVAVNAILSGCSADLLPICIAIARALADEDYLREIAEANLVPMVFVNGPVGRQVGVDSEQGMTTEEVNVCLGRFVEFALMNLAGIDHGRGGYFGAVPTLVFAENDQACLDAGWQPYHVQKGFDLNDSTVTMTSFGMWGNNLTPATDWPEEIMKLVAWDITEKNLGGLGGADSKTYSKTKRTLLITPPVALALNALYKSKGALEGDLAFNARRPMWLRAFACCFSGDDGVPSGGKSLSDVYDELVATAEEDARITVSPAWLNGITSPKIMTGAALKAGNMRILVTGDASRNKTQVMPGGKSVTVELELPEAWDSLLVELQHKQLSQFALQPHDAVVHAPVGVPAVLTDGTYRILDPATGDRYLTQSGRLYFDATANMLYCYPVGRTAKTSMALDPVAFADFISYVENLGYNSSFTVASGKIGDVVIRFSSNDRKLENNTVALGVDAFAGGLTLHANSTPNSRTAGGVAVSGSSVIMSASVKSFTADLSGGQLVLGETTDAGFVTLNGSVVTLNAGAQAGSRAIVGVRNEDGSYRTLTLVMKASDTYEVIYNACDTLSLKKGLCTGGTIQNVSGEYVVTPRSGFEAVALADLPDDAALGINVNGHIIPGAAFWGFGMLTEGLFSLALKPPEFVDDGVNRPIAVGANGVSICVRTFDNLVYTLRRAADLGEEFAPVGGSDAQVIGTGSPVSLLDARGECSADKAFYTVDVSVPAPATIVE